MKLARLVVLESESGEAPWHPVPPTDVPEWVKDPEVVGSLIAGEMAQCGDSGWFRAEKLEDSTLLVSAAPNLKHKPEVLQKYQ